MSQRLAWEALSACPEARPYWCSHPHCLWCNWDDEAHDAWALAAHLGATPVRERHYDPRFPAGHYVQDRRYVAWLCEDCAADAEVARWFAATVRQVYPEAALMRAPGGAAEGPFDTP